MSDFLIASSEALGIWRQVLCEVSAELMEAFLRHLEMLFVMNAQREKSHPNAHFFPFLFKKNQHVPQDPINISGSVYSCVAVSSKYVIKHPNGRFVAFAALL